jgi:EVE domain
MPRMPTPLRTKRGSGAGAKLTLTIDYYRSPDGLADDFGFVYGRDDDGAWELNFEGNEELERQMDSLVSALRDIATVAREELADERSSNRNVWLKSIGAQGLQPDEIWWDERNRTDGVDFPFRPKSIKPGDLLVVYAAGTGKLVGVMEVLSDWYEAKRHARWPYRMDTKIIAARPVSEGVSLELLNGEREIGKSIRQKSHIKLRNGEATEALKAFEVD